MPPLERRSADDPRGQAATASRILDALGWRSGVGLAIVAAALVGGPTRGRAAPAVGQRPELRPGAGVGARSEDGRFAAHLTLWGQLLTALRREDAASPAMSPTTTLGIELRRARVVLSGHTFSPHLKYNLHLMFAPRDLAWKDGSASRPPIFQWWLRVDRLRHAHLQVGFFFTPFAGQRMQPPPRLPMIDTSSAMAEFTLDQDLGLQVSAPDLGGRRGGRGRLRAFAGVFAGEGYDYARAGDLGLMYVGRVDVLPLGMIYDPVDGDATGARPLRLCLGLAYAFTDRDRRARVIDARRFADGGSSSAHHLTADLTLRWSRLSLVVDVFHRDGWRQPGGAVDGEGLPIPVQAPRNGHGWTVQAGLFVWRSKLEAIARASGVRPSRSSATSLARVDEAAVGLNYYFVRHGLKVQVDYVHARGPGVPTGRSDRGQLQLQVMF